VERVTRVDTMWAPAAMRPQSRVEREKAARTHAVLDVVSEHPEEEHVAKQGSHPP